MKAHPALFGGGRIESGEREGEGEVPEQFTVKAHPALFGGGGVRGGGEG